MVFPRPPSPVEIPAADLERTIRAGVGLRVRESDLAAVGVWIGSRIERLGLGSLDAYARMLADAGEPGRSERETLTVRLTTGETYFMRDGGQIALLRRELLPDLITRRTATRRLRLWSAGCSSGEEAYTLAMLLAEFGTQLEGWTIEILATDINREALAAAAAGRYGEWSFRALDPRIRERYFRRSGKDWLLSDHLRRMVRFRTADLLDDEFPGATAEFADCDLIVCRNVFIYMDADAVARVAAKLTGCLAEGGYFLTGHGELLGHQGHGLHTRMFDESIVLHRRHADLPPVVPPAPGVVLTGVESVAIPQINPGGPRPTVTAPDFAGEMRRAWQLADAGDLDGADRACHAARVLAPLDPWPHYLLAQLSQERGDIGTARRLLDRAIYLDHGMIAAYLDLSALYERDGMADRARVMLQTALRELRKLRADAVVPPFDRSTAADLLHFVECRLADRDPRPVGAGATVPPRLRA